MSSHPSCLDSTSKPTAAPAAPGLLGRSLLRAVIVGATPAALLEARPLKNGAAESVMDSAAPAQSGSERSRLAPLPLTCSPLLPCGQGLPFIRALLSCARRGSRRVGGQSRCLGRRFRDSGLGAAGHDCAGIGERLRLLADDVVLDFAPDFHILV